jgi:hypothetical protein
MEHELDRDSSRRLGCASTEPRFARADQRTHSPLGPEPPTADQFSNVTEVAAHFADADQDARFELLIDLFVEGLARRAAGDPAP